jgi:hypothetical protein
VQRLARHAAYVQPLVELKPFLFHFYRVNF